MRRTTRLTRRASPWRARIMAGLAALPLLFRLAYADETESCIRQAAERFRVPPSLIKAIMKVEGGRVGAVSHNRNGSYDIGPMHINSIWLPEIERRGGSLELITHHRCANIHFGTWLLSRELAGLDPARIDRARFWRAVGNYHSRTPVHNERYARAVWSAWRSLAP
ncbi:MAG: lytic transglycosylase domain-containing protein [Azovibrio sp.]|nr:lytic transglycosylase domain-containing protein [Azovibrio sp.]